MIQRRGTDENVCYTQQSINIIDENDTVVATRKWWGVEYDESNENMYEEDPISYGKFDIIQVGLNINE